MFAEWLDGKCTRRQFFYYAAQYGYKWADGTPAAADDYKRFEDNIYVVARDGVLTWGDDWREFCNLNIPTAREMISNDLSEAAIYEQLAEECAEAAKEALKVARILRIENPTPCTYAEAVTRLQGELSDIKNVLAVMGECVAGDEGKLYRWAMRLDK